MTEADEDVLRACSVPAVLSRQDGCIRIRQADLRSDGDVERYHDWCKEHEAVIVQQVPGEGLICGVVGCMAQATHAVVEYRKDADCSEVTACPGHLAPVILTVFGLVAHGPQRPVWN